MTTTYKEAGVDIEAGDRFVEQISPIVRTTMRPEVVAPIGGFSGLFSLTPGRYKDPLLVAATDGVGTKLRVAHLANKHETVGIDLVAMCVNDIVVCGAEPLFFLDYYATSKLEPEQGKQVVSGIADGCRQAGCALLGGETAEMPGFYKPGEYDLAGFSVGVVERDKVLGSHLVKNGDVLLGLASTGLHSNGYSLARKVLLNEDESNINDKIPGLDTTIAEELLKPTFIYVSVALEIAGNTETHAFAHITGGGLPGNLPRVLPENLAAEVKANSWNIHPIFRTIQERAKVDDQEMLRTFNMGIGLVVILAEDNLEKAQQIASSHKIDSWPIGQVIERKSGSFVLC
jgi:phosphoribosylformylglycinamidine cyclo-ligase